MQRIDRYTDEQEQDHLFRFKNEYGDYDKNPLLQNLVDTLIPKDMTDDEYRGYVAGLTSALELGNQESVAILLAIAIQRKNKIEG